MSSHVPNSRSYFATAHGVAFIRVRRDPGGVGDPNAVHHMSNDNTLFILRQAERAVRLSDRLTRERAKDEEMIKVMEEKEKLLTEMVHDCEELLQSVHELDLTIKGRQKGAESRT